MVKSIAEIGQHVVTIEALSMTRVERCRSPPDQHGSRQERLQVALGREEPLPFWLVLSHCAGWYPLETAAEHHHPTLRSGDERD